MEGNHQFGIKQRRFLLAKQEILRRKRKEEGKNYSTGLKIKDQSLTSGIPGSDQRSNMRRE